MPRLLVKRIKKTLSPADWRDRKRPCPKCARKNQKTVIHVQPDARGQKNIDRGKIPRRRKSFPRKKGKALKNVVPKKTLDGRLDFNARELRDPREKWVPSERTWQ